MKRLLLATLALFASPALAATQNGFVIPPDVPAYVAVTPTYAAGTAVNEPIDPSVTPPTAVALTDIPSTITDQVSTGGVDGDSGYKLTTVDGGPGAEAKFRTHANCAKIAYTDPIRNYGQQGASHLHQFFGNTQINDFSTFAGLRTLRRSVAGGGDLNATGYWFPAPIRTNPFGDGKNYSPKCKYAVIYYVVGPETARQTTKLRLGLRYVSGFNMDDPNKVWLQSVVDAANAQPGTSGRYSITNPVNGEYNGQFFWKCATTGPGSTGSEELQPWLKNADGSDPFNGHCQAGDDLALNTTASDCWDGVNLWSPGGYSHVIPEIYDNLYSKFVCPTNYYRIPTLLLNIWFEHQGPSDYMNWRLSSDDMAQAKLTALGTPRTILNGESAHFDWMNGWDGATLDSWQSNCIGAENGTPHECGDGRISATTNLRAYTNPNTVTIFGSTQTRSPQVELGSTADISSADGRFEIPANPNGPVTVHVHGG